MHLFAVVILLSVMAAGCASNSQLDQHRAVAASLGISQDEVAAVARHASERHNLVVVWIKKTEDGAIEVALADKPERPHGIIVIFRKIDGRWVEDPESQSEWIV